jgi:excinuclease ABC subunit A
VTAIPGKQTANQRPHENPPDRIKDEALVSAFISLRGARVHNLKNVSVDIPHHRLTVVTGVSGSGKSSLVFDTIYAEGQRRYVESLSAYARQFLERMEKPDLDSVDGIAPPIAIHQKNTTRNPRSTVATATEIYDFMRLLWARAGTTWCPNCAAPVERDTVDVVARKMLAQREGSRWYALFPVAAPATIAAQGKKPPPAAPLRDRLFDLRAKGFNRLYQDGRTFEFSTPESLLEIDFAQAVFALVDRFAIAPDLRQRLVDAIETCYREGGEAIFEEAGAYPPRQVRFSEAFACKTCGKEFAEPEPQLFSFNNPRGACPRCQGFGRTIDYDMDLVVPDPSLSLEQGAVDPWSKPSYRWFYEDFRARHQNAIRWKVPYAELTAGEKAAVARGVRDFFAEIETKKYKVHVRVFLSRYRGYAPCAACGGSRLREEARYVRLSGRTIGEVAALNIAEALAFFHSMTLAGEQRQVADKILIEIRQRLNFLNNVGLDYLTLDRLTATLSGGEAQRIQLATCLGSRLVGACYVLDEPSIGLHHRDTGRLIRILEELRDLGNTVLVVEHDPEIMRAADYLIDLGPAAGERGGQVVFAGAFGELVNSRNGHSTLTSRYLRGELDAVPKRKRRKSDAKRMLRFLGARANNLRGIDVAIPLGLLVAVTGVSGSGKSTLVHEVIHKTLDRLLRQRNPDRPALAPDNGEQTAEKATCREVRGAEKVADVVLVDQSPIGRTPRSNPVTYVKAFEPVRELFAATPEAKRLGYTAGHFSFNIPGGRCETCQGDGTVTVEMQFLADVELVCEDCHGTRFKPSVLGVLYRGKSIHDVLRMTVDEARSFFADIPKLAAKLEVLADVGLGYLRLGQSATTLSGGEAQRVKLAAYLGQASVANTLFIFDEPTTGLHFDDIAKLLDAFQRLIEQGGSVLLIEHNLDVIRAADWVIDLGPEGGAGGGTIVCEGTPEQVAAHPQSHTGRALRSVLEPRS